MKIYIQHEKIPAIEVTTQEELCMVLQTFGVLPSAIPVQIPAQEQAVAFDSSAALMPQEHLRPSLTDRLKELYHDFPEGRVHQKILQILAQAAGDMTSAQLRTALGYQKNHQVAAVMAPLSRRAKKFKVRYEDIITSDKLFTPDGPVQKYRLTKPMREAMEELGFSAHQEGMQALVPAVQTQQKHNLAEMCLSKKE